MQNDDAVKFCRSCGTDVGTVSAVMSGDLPAHFTNAGVAQVHHDAKRRSDPNEVFGDAMKSIITGIGFLVVSMALLLTGVAGGRTWWWAMLFPAFGLLAKGIPDYLKSKRMEAANSQAYAAQLTGEQQQGQALPSANQTFIEPESRYKTGDLVPPSVTDRTTRHLEINKEGETMTLPKK